MNEPGDIPTIVHEPDSSGELIWLEDGVEKPFVDASAENQHTWLEDSFDWAGTDDPEEDDGEGHGDDGIVWL